MSTLRIDDDFELHYQVHGDGPPVRADPLIRGDQRPAWWSCGEPVVVIRPPRTG
jgi:hypothetical protein